MKPLRLLLPLLFVAGAAFAQATYSWDFSKSTGTGGAAETPDASGQFALVFASGATVAADAGSPGGQALVLDGSQAEPGQTARATAPWPGASIALRFKPSGQGPERQTIVAFGNAYELRYVTKGQRLEFIVFTADRKFTITQIRAAAGAWHDVRAVFADGRLRLTVGKDVKEAALPAGVTIDARGTRVRVGRQGDRAFAGSLASLTIAAP
jgi:hypothetical protein